MRKYFQGWNPLVNPLHGLEVMVRWREILERKEAENSAFSLTLAQGTAHGEEAYVSMKIFSCHVILLFSFKILLYSLYSLLRMKMYDRLVWEVWMPFLRSVMW